MSEHEILVAAQPRYRCTACGNLTRFDVTVRRTTREFHHYDVGGERTIEDVEVIEEATANVSCRWCGSSEAIARIDGEC